LRTGWLTSKPFPEGVEAGAHTEGGQTQTTAEADLWGGSDHGVAVPVGGAGKPVRALTGRCAA